MEDLYVLNVEKPSGTCYASGSLQMGNEEGQSPKRTESREPTHPNSKGPADATSLAQQETYNQSRQQKSHQKRQQIGAVRVEQHNGDQDKKRIKKRKRANLDAVDEELGMDGKPEGGKTQEKGRGKKQKIEETKCGVDSAEGEGEGEGEEMSEEEGGGEKEKEKGKEKGKEKQRFILFIGNLKYTTSVDIIKTHFSACDPPPEVRLLTPKTSSNGKTTIKSKGCAFLEFSNKTSLQQALKQHHSMLEGRMINVELTAGGGGKGENRLEKLRKRNQELLGQRIKKADRKDKRDGSLPSRPNKPQRYSATSGIEQTSAEKKRTWTVGDAAEDEVHRGGQKHKKVRGSRKPKTRDWGTGVNAIPVG